MKITDLVKKLKRRVDYSLDQSMPGMTKAEADKYGEDDAQDS